MTEKDSVNECRQKRVEEKGERERMSKNKRNGRKRKGKKENWWRRKKNRMDNIHIEE